MTRLLVTGIEGFVGGHLCRLLASQSDSELYGSVCSKSRAVIASVPSQRISVCDVLDRAAVGAMLRRVRPDAIFHLAGRAEVGKAWEEPEETLRTNIFGSLNLILAILQENPPCRLLVVGSAGVYGRVAEADCPLSEDAPVRPEDPYSVSKAAQEILALQYFRSHALQVLAVRPFNHIGPGQSPHFLVGRLAQRIAQIESGQDEPVLSIGNLSARRDFTDVRDVARAYSLLMRHGRPGEVYNVASGRAVQVGEVVQIALSLSARPIRLQPDPALARPADPPLLVGDSSRLTAATGWKPEIPLEQSVADALTHARALQTARA